MREIKFRLVKDGKIVGYERHTPDEDGNMYRAWNATNKGGWILAEPPKHDTKNSYTNLKDKNGKEIYEGDILEDDSIWWEVYWSDDMARWEARNIHGDLDMELAEAVGQHTFVIGNIYENPELLETNPQ